jgi:hypothetical protein
VNDVEETGDRFRGSDSACSTTEPLVSLTIVGDKLVLSIMVCLPLTIMGVDLALESSKHF